MVRSGIKQDLLYLNIEDGPKDYFGEVSQEKRGGDSAGLFGVSLITGAFIKKQDMQGPEIALLIFYNI
jgi:hypothetical protein